jgi:hypothetical protein
MAKYKHGVGAQITPVTACGKGLLREYVDTRVLLVDGWEILRPEGDRLSGRGSAGRSI